jgi:thymidylate synthase
VELVTDTGREAYVQLLAALLESDTGSAPRGFDTRELLNVTVTVKDGTQAHVAGTARRFNRRIAATETLHLLAGLSSLEQLDQASGGRFSQFADGGRLRGAYGPRLYRQLQQVVHLLQSQPQTRQAYFTIWNGEEHEVVTHDVPCTTGGQFLLRDGELHLRVNMRSSDVYLGIPYDWLMFSRLQMVVAACLGVKVGSYTHAIGSQHLYERDVAEAQRIVDQGVGVPVDISVPPALTDRVTEHMMPWQNFQAITQMARKLATGDGSIASSTAERWYRTNVPRLAQPQFKLCLNCWYVLNEAMMSSEWRCQECS